MNQKTVTSITSKKQENYKRHKEMQEAEDVAAYLQRQEKKELLRFITCGSVDDGKSTLIGRLLHDSKMLYEDQLASLHSESKSMGRQYGNSSDKGKESIDFSLLVDGLEAEREQGITIDVAYRYFSTDKRKFIIADTPGHEQYTRNMATGASTANLAVILVDAQAGVTIQTKRHTFITTLLGISQLVVAVNKMDLVNFEEKVFENIQKDFLKFLEKISLKPKVTFIPVSALLGDNVVEPSTHMPWYVKKPLLSYLENVYIRNAMDEDGQKKAAPLRFPVQYVNRPTANFRGYCGTLCGGEISTGDRVMVLPSRKIAEVDEIFCADKKITKAQAPMAVTLTLAQEVDIVRGDFLVQPNYAPPVVSEFDAYFVWMNDTPLLTGRQYDFKSMAGVYAGSVSKIYYLKDVNTLERKKADTLELNEIGFCHVILQKEIPVDDYQKNHESGSFIVIDRGSHATLAAGMVALEKAKKQESIVNTNIVWHQHLVTKALRSNSKAQKSCLLWFTGLSGSGKSTIAGALEAKLFQKGYHTYLLDGDNIRHGLNSDLGFSDKDRSENIRRIGEVAKLMTDAGLIVLCAFVSPFRKDRQLVRSLFDENEFYEIFIDAPLSVCEFRDPKGLYKKARKGLIPDFTGVNSPYEAPVSPELHLTSDTMDVEECVAQIMEGLDKHLL